MDGKIFWIWLAIMALGSGFVWGRWTTPEYVARQEARKLAFEERLREPDVEMADDYMSPRDILCDDIIEDVRDLLDDEYMRDGRAMNR